MPCEVRMQRESESRKVVVIFLGNEFVIETNSDGSKLSASQLKGMLGNPPFTSMGQWELRLMDGITSTDSTLKEAHGEINVEGVDVCWVQNWWQEPKESLFDLLEERIRDVMSQKKSKKARRTAPSEWTRSIGFSTQALGAGGHETKAPYTAGKGISSGGLQDKNDMEMFQLVGKIIGEDFGDFGTLFQQTGRVDLKYNTSITEEDMHFDKQDVCHQVVFTLGSSRAGVVVKEAESTTTIACHRLPTAFDGRHQHWVEKKSTKNMDRIAVVCYIADAPESFKHEMMSVEDLRRKYETK